MANVSVWVLRNTTTKQLLAVSYDQFTLQAGQEEVQETVDESDVPIFGQKYKFNPSTGVLEINGKGYYVLEFSTDAGSFSPNGIPQLNVGGQDSFNLTIDKKDIQGNSHISASDNDTLDVYMEDGKADASTVALVNGQIVIAVKSGMRKGKTEIRFETDEIIGNSFEFLTV